jgi:hypothetical protein
VEDVDAKRLTESANDSFPVLFDDAREMDVQLKTNIEKQDRAKRGKNDSGGMKSSTWRGKQVCNGPADDRSDDAEDDRPENRHVNVQHRFGDNSRDQTHHNVPDQVNHIFSPSCAFRK